MFLPPDYAPFGSTVREQKKTPQHKSTYTITHDFATGGNISSSGKQPSGPVPFIAAPVADLLDSVAVQSGQRQLIGEGE